jgi:UDP-N-acetylglucosamine 2-epimerase (non-hydrolysing)
VKLAPVAAALAEAGHRHVIVHTGQHYDARLSDVFFADLHIPAPDVHMGVGSGTHGVQTGTMMASLDPILDAHRPDCVLVYGDTNSTLAAALCAVKMHLPLAHLEAGLRSFNRRMPEEHNRVLTDHASDLCLAPTSAAMAHLAAEGLAPRARLVGDVMTDVLLRTRDAVRGTPPELPDGVDPGAGYYVATVHRAENTDDGARLARIIRGLASLDRPVLLPAHPRLCAAADRHGIELASGAVRVVDPQPYPQMVSLVVHGRGVVTDSGGLQKEAFLLRRPCTTLRTETEWTETVELGWNTLVDVDTVDRLAEVVGRPEPEPVSEQPYGDGRAARRAVAAIEQFLAGAAGGRAA